MCDTREMSWARLGLFNELSESNYLKLGPRGRIFFLLLYHFHKGFAEKCQYCLNACALALVKLRLPRGLTPFSLNVPVIA